MCLCVCVLSVPISVCVWWIWTQSGLAGDHLQLGLRPLLKCVRVCFVSVVHVSLHLSAAWQPEDKITKKNIYNTLLGAQCIQSLSTQRKASSFSTSGNWTPCSTYLDIQRTSKTLHVQSCSLTSFSPIIVISPSLYSPACQSFCVFACAFFVHCILFASGLTAFKFVNMLSV